MSPLAQSHAAPAGLAVALILLGAGFVRAQTGVGLAKPQSSSRPYQGLFGGASSGTDRDPFALSVTIAEAHDQDLLGDVITGPSAYQIGGRFTELSADASYRLDTHKVQFAATGGTNFRYYDEQDAIVGVGQYGGAGVWIPLSRSTSFAANQTVSYAPSYLYRLFVTPGAPELGQVNPGTDYAVNQSPSLSYGTTASLTTTFGPRNELAFDTHRQYTDYVRSADLQTLPIGTLVQSDLSTYQIGGRFSRGMSRDVKLNLGYTFTRADYYSGITPAEHGVNAGFTYTHPTSKTRKTSLSFRVGSSRLELADTGDQGTVLRPYYRTVGDVTFMREFGRTWQANAAYHRGVGFVDGLRTPVLTDGVLIGANGMINRRVDVSVNAASTIGEPTTVVALRGFRTNTATARTQMALNHNAALFAEYLFYFYDFPIGLTPIGAPPRVSRNGVRAGLSLWVPMRTR
jgi:hypothetical protein